MTRLFFALVPPATVRAQLAAIQAAVIPPRARPIPVANLHLTLAFLGPVSDSARAALLGHPAPPAVGGFEIVLDRVGLWRRREIAWLAPATPAPALTALAGHLAACGERAGVPGQARDFRPHVTLARRCRRLRQGRAGAGPEVRVSWPVREYALMASVTVPGGVRYDVLATRRLAPAPR